MLFDDSDFAHLTPAGTADYALSEVHIPRGNPNPVVLVVKPAGEANDRLRNAEIKAPAVTGKEALRQRASLFAKHVIAGWKHVLDKDGKPIAYTADGGEELLHRLIDAKRGEDLVVPFMVFARNPNHFTGPQVDAGDLGNG